MGQNGNELLLIQKNSDQTKTFCFRSDLKRTKSKRFAFVPIICFDIGVFFFAFVSISLTLLVSTIEDEHNIGNQAVYLRKGEKGLLPQSTIDYQGEIAEKNLLPQLSQSSFLSEKG
jgi:hypothetical protein